MGYVCGPPATPRPRLGTGESGQGERGTLPGKVKAFWWKAGAEALKEVYKFTR